MKKLERPTTPAEIRALIRKRDREIAVVENALRVRHPAHIRRLMLMNLKGLRANRESWKTYLERRAA